MTELEQIALERDMWRQRYEQLVSPPRLPTIHAIIQVVADELKISTALIRGPVRDAKVCRARQIAMYLARQLSGKSLPQIAKVMGDRDHTTVMHGVNKIARLRAADANLDALITRLEGLVS